MMKEVVRAFQNITLGEIGLVAFVLAFVLIVIYALTLNKSTRDEAKQIPLLDDELHTPDALRP
jgi:cbb3-type cytochrome oxidase subunit 3